MKNGKIYKIAPTNNKELEGQRFVNVFGEIKTDVKTSGVPEAWITMTRMCDGCETQIQNPDDALICNCSNSKCPMKSYDLCPTCVENGISQTKCPSGYGCGSRK